ncbi:hypothetical protein [Nocardioides plantarum]|uniref:CASP-like protein n=1 Tax=Nocardioides plantarum TaxID=29299 RepID=A0ABV5K5W9_9ACTN|nr:hypothetical protein [Nocardioides plantarum]
MGDDTTTTGEGDSTKTTTTTAATEATAPKSRRRSWAGRSAGAGGGGAAAQVAKVRVLLARVLWAVCAVFALILAAAVLLIAVDANTDNELVRWVIARADNVDLGFFDLSNPIKDWDKDETDVMQDVKTALFNYGLAAIVWLGIGKLLDKVVRP